MSYGDRTYKISLALGPSMNCIISLLLLYGELEVPNGLLLSALGAVLLETIPTTMWFSPKLMMWPF